MITRIYEYITVTIFISIKIIYITFIPYILWLYER